LLLSLLWQIIKNGIIRRAVEKLPSIWSNIAPPRSASVEKVPQGLDGDYYQKALRKLPIYELAFPMERC
jgi:hypothetical protein